MTPDLENYQPTGNQVLLKVISKNKIGEIWLPRNVSERWMPVVKLGSVVSSLEIGDTALLGELRGGNTQLSFGDDKYIQVFEHDVIGKISGNGVQNVGSNLSEENVNVA